MSPLQRRTLVLAVAGLGILEYRNPAVRRWFVPTRRTALENQRAAGIRILPISIREKYIR